MVRFFLIVMAVFFSCNVSQSYAAVQDTLLQKVQPNNPLIKKYQFIANAFNEAQKTDADQQEMHDDAFKYEYLPIRKTEIYYASLKYSDAILHVVQSAGPLNCGARVCGASFYYEQSGKIQNIGSISIGEQVFGLECALKDYVLFHGSENTYAGGSDVSDPKYSVWQINEFEMKHLGFIAVDARHHCAAIREFK